VFVSVLASSFVMKFYVTDVKKFQQLLVVLCVLGSWSVSPRSLPRSHGKNVVCYARNSHW